MITSNLKQETLSKVANLGAQNISKTLSQWAHEKVDVHTTTDIIDLEEAHSIIRTPNGSIVMYIEILGDSSPGITFIFINKKDALSLIDLINANKLGKTKKLDDINKSALLETDNILIGSYLNCLGNMTNIPLVPSVPKLIPSDKIKELIDYAITKSKEGKDIMFVHELMIKPHNMKIDVMLVFDIELLHKVSM